MHVVIAPYQRCFSVVAAHNIMYSTTCQLQPLLPSHTHRECRYSGQRCLGGCWNLGHCCASTDRDSGAVVTEATEVWIQGHE